MLNTSNGGASNGPAIRPTDISSLILAMAARGFFLTDRELTAVFLKFDLLQPILKPSVKPDIR